MKKRLTLLALTLIAFEPAVTIAGDGPVTLESAQTETHDLIRSFNLKTPAIVPCPYEVTAKWVRVTCGQGWLWPTWYYHAYLEITTKITSRFAYNCPASISLQIPRTVATNTSDSNRCHILWNRDAAAPAALGEITFAAKSVRVSLPGKQRFALEGDWHPNRNARKANPYGGPPIDGSYFCMNNPPVWFFLPGTGPAGSDKPHAQAEIVSFNNFSTIPKGGY